MNRTSVVDQLPVYIFDEINRLKHEARVAGRDVIDLGMGNPDLPTPRPIVEKLREAVLDPRNHRYSVSRGIMGLRRELARWYERKFSISLADEQILVTLGAKEGFTHLIQAVVDPGEAVLLTSPCYPIHRYAVQIARALPVALAGTETEGLVEKIQTALQQEPRPRTLILSYPNNPTTHCVERSFFEELIPLARREDLLVIHDFSYADLVFDGYKAPSILEVPGASEVSVEFYSMSKGYSMAGWRVGFCVGNAQVISKLRRLKSYLDYGMFQPIQIAAAIALRDCDAEVEKIRETYEKRRDCLIQGLERLNWVVQPPRGTIFVWAPLPSHFRQRGSLEFARHLLTQANVAVSPGIGFGPEGEGWVRMALVENVQRISQAVRNLKRVLQLEVSSNKGQAA
ncbi:MAG: aminotransferase class I/II-fold pyridoxal phosphate-dependent enzyme [Acidobacteria bacterium]|nr:aminotransferase class I/II-fold pyridoxal phosphate-dependent enzyme [Acidobacteriota bacterium]